MKMLSVQDVPAGRETWSLQTPLVLLCVAKEDITLAAIPVRTDSLITYKMPYELV